MTESTTNPQASKNTLRTNVLNELDTLLKEAEEKKEKEATEIDKVINEIADRVEGNQALETRVQNANQAKGKPKDFVEGFHEEEKIQTAKIQQIQNLIDQKKELQNHIGAKIKQVEETLGTNAQTAAVLEKARQEMKHHEQEIETLEKELEITKQETIQMKAKHQELKAAQDEAAKDKLDFAVKNVVFDLETKEPSRPSHIDEQTLKARAQVELKRRAGERQAAEDQVRDAELEKKERAFFREAKTGLNELKNVLTKLCDEMDALKNPTTKSGKEFDSWMQAKQTKRIKLRKNKNYFFNAQTKRYQDQLSAEEVQKEIEEKINSLIKTLDEAYEKLNELTRKYCNYRGTTLSLDHTNHNGETYKDPTKKQRMHAERTAQFLEYQNLRNFYDTKIIEYKNWLSRLKTPSDYRD